MVTSKMVVKDGSECISAEELAARKPLMSAKGKLGLPKLLDERRLKYGITDGAFAFQPYNDSVVIHQLSRVQGETFAGSSILMSDKQKEREREGTPQGVIVAAGLCGLDGLRMNGMDLGHIVAFQRVAPWRVQTDLIGGNWEQVLIMRIADIVGSLDLVQNLRSGKMKVSFDKERYEHIYENTETGEIWHPSKNPAFQPER